MERAAPATADPIKLAAFDTEDLAVVSAHLQDAVVRARDMAWLPKARRFALVLGRFDWPGAAGGRCERRQSGLHIDHVRSVASAGFDPKNGATVLNLLSLGFAPGDAPAGSLTLIFSGGAAVRLDVDCIELSLSDLGPSWPAAKQPGHPLAGGA